LQVPIEGRDDGTVNVVRLETHQGTGVSMPFSIEAVSDDDVKTHMDRMLEEEDCGAS